jgi:hypothetical protein
MDLRCQLKNLIFLYRVKMNLDIIKNEFKIAQPDYASAKIQAQKIDEWLGFNCTPIEDKLFEQNQEKLFSSSQQFWFGLELQSMQTPYSEIVEMINLLKPQDEQLWVDLGAAYGRMGIVLGLKHPKVKFIGYEVVSERVDEGNRIFKNWKLASASLKKADISQPECMLEAADVYFLYDFGSKKDVYIVLEKLRLIAQKKSICVIARGRGMKNWILMDLPWLYDIHPPQHFANWSIFRS